MASESTMSIYSNYYLIYQEVYCSLFLVFVKQNQANDVDVIFIAYSYRLL